MNKTVRVMHNTKSVIRGLVCVYIGFFVAFFDINNTALRKTNSLGKTLDTRQKKLCAALKHTHTHTHTYWQIQTHQPKHKHSQIHACAYNSKGKDISKVSMFEKSNIEFEFEYL